MELQDRISPVGDARQMRRILRHRMAAREHRPDGNSSGLQDCLPLFLGELLLKERRRFVLARRGVESIDMMEPVLDCPDANGRWRGREQSRADRGQRNEAQHGDQEYSAAAHAVWHGRDFLSEVKEGNPSQRYYVPPVSGGGVSNSSLSDQPSDSNSRCATLL